jgi:hypothetical protein
MYQKTIITALLLTLAFATKAQTLQPVNVLQANHSYTKKIESNTSSKSSFGGTLMENKSITTLVNQINIASKNGDSLLVSTSIQKMKTKVEAMGQTIEYDSENLLTTDNTTRNMFGNIIGSGSTFFINKQGIITSIDSTKKLTVTADAALPNMNSLTIGNSSDIFLIVNSPKNVGDVWVDSIITSNTKSVNKYTFLKTELNIATIQQQSTLEITGNMEQMGMKMEINQKGTATGTIKVNTKNGLIVSKELVTKLDGVIKTDNGLAINSNIETKTKETVEN